MNSSQQQLKFWETFQATVLSLWGVSAIAYIHIEPSDCVYPLFSHLHQIICPGLLLASCLGLNRIIINTEQEPFSKTEQLSPLLWSISLAFHISDNLTTWKKSNGAAWVTGILACMIIIKKNTTTIQKTYAAIAGISYLMKLILDIVKDFSEESTQYTLNLSSSICLIITGFSSAKQNHIDHFSQESTYSPQQIHPA